MNEDFSKYEYAVIEPSDDATAARIEKRGIKADFTIAEMRNQQAKTEKIVRELSGTLDLETSKAANIREHHPHVATMSMEDLFACKLYYESMALVDQLPAKIKELSDAIEESKTEEAHIVATLGLTFPDPVVESLVDTAMENLEKGEAPVEAEPADDAPAAAE